MLTSTPAEESNEAVANNVMEPMRLPLLPTSNSTPGAISTPIMEALEPGAEESATSCVLAFASCSACCSAASPGASSKPRSARPSCSVPDAAVSKASSATDQKGKRVTASTISFVVDLAIAPTLCCLSSCAGGGSICPGSSLPVEAPATSPPSSSSSAASDPRPAAAAAAAASAPFSEASSACGEGRCGGAPGEGAASPSAPSSKHSLSPASSSLLMDWRLSGGPSSCLLLTATMSELSAQTCPTC
mmetsp:Transcript_52771/g.138414  ORF Transcript_52771/g.138414 Transcript_52771/m.138414 type:complete len:246 (-) Transcript_52771:376-1113(-)